MVGYLGIHQRLRKDLHYFRQLRKLLPCLHHHLKQMQCTQQAVSCGILIQKDNMARLFSSQACTDFLHALQDIPVTHFCLFYFHPVLFPHQEKSQVTHNRSHDGVLFQHTMILHIAADNSHNLVAVYNLSVLINSQQSVGITVKRKAYISLLIYYSCL